MVMSAARLVKQKVHRVRPTKGDHQPDWTVSGPWL
jgi:hypothetical protein